MIRPIHWLLLPGLALLSAFGQAQEEAPATIARQSFDVTVPQAPTPVRMLGRAQLTYEIHLTNFSDSPLTVKRVRIVDPADRIVADVAGEALERRLTRVSGPGRAVAPGYRSILFVETDLQPGNVPRSLRPVIDYKVAGDDRLFRTEAPWQEIRAASPVVLGPPLAGGPWAAVHDPSWQRGHRRVFYTIDGRARLPGRYAIDFIKLDLQGRTTTGDADRTGDAFGYGDDVLAVADGEIVGMRDDVAESPLISRNPAHPLGEGAGNYVALRLRNGQVAFYEHLRPGNVRVRPGERVRQGQVIGTLGFTGDTTGPHLHFHLADANSLLGAEGVPFVFDRFTLLGRIDDMAQFGKAPWHAPMDLTPERRREWPGFNTVLAFGTVESLKPRQTRR
ncbi:MAG: M23 family metallopeptidase [Pseudomonadota bacterium]|jgi:murein DD-endopeptidase MepM/ murein hydrolase activator NlpD